MKSNKNLMRKELSLALVLCMLLTSIGVSAGNPEPLGVLAPFATSEADPGFDLLLQGFNVLGEQMLGRNSLNKLTTIAGEERLRELNIDHGVRNFTGGTNTTGGFYSAMSMEQLAFSLGIDLSMTMGASVSAGMLFSAQTKARYKLSTDYSYKTSTENYFAMMQVHRELGRNYLSNVGDLQRYNQQIWGDSAYSADGALSPAFKEMLAYGNIDDVFKTYGTHIITSYNFGGVAESYLSVTKTSTEHDFSLAAEMGMESGVNAPIKGVNIGMQKEFSAAVETALNLKKEDHIVNIKPNVSGGNLGIGSAMAVDGDFSKYDEWLSSIDPGMPKNTTEIFINDHLQFAGIWEFLPADQFAARRAELEREYLIRARAVYDGFFDEFIYKTPPHDVIYGARPVIDNSFVAISTADDLNAVRYNLNGNYILSCDIDLTGWDNWEPIGTASAPFTGVFYGNGNVVHGGLYSNVQGEDMRSGIRLKKDADALGLFGVNAGTISRLGVVYGSRYAGIAGVNNGVVEFCYQDYAPSKSATKISSITALSSNVGGTEVLVDWSSVANTAVNKIITINSSVQTVTFKGIPSHEFTGLNLIVEGDTDVVFDNFSFVGGASSPAIQFNGASPAIMSIGAENTIRSVGSYPTINATKNLFIGGHADISFLQTGLTGQNAVTIAGTLSISLSDAVLTTKGANGSRGKDGTIGNIGSTGNKGTDGTLSSRNGGTGGTGGTGVTGGAGQVGGSGGHGISADTIRILNNTSLKTSGGDGGDGGTGGAGGQGGVGGQGGNGYGTGNVQSPGNAGAGGVGGIGGAGGVGGAGGTGGDGLNVDAAKLYLSDHSQLESNSGKGGQGGVAGKGGPGGRGGISGVPGYGNLNASTYSLGLGDLTVASQDDESLEEPTLGKETLGEDAHEEEVLEEEILEEEVLEEEILEEEILEEEIPEEEILEEVTQEEILNESYDDSSGEPEIPFEDRLAYAPQEPLCFDGSNQGMTIEPFSIVIEVSTVTQLRNAFTNTTAGRTIRLLNDISLGTWSPMSLSGNSANFTLDGNGYILTFYMDISSKYAGLFSTVTNGNITIRNLGLQQTGIRATSSTNVYAGGLIGFVSGGSVKVERSFITGTGWISAKGEFGSSSAYSHAGGFFGEINSASVSITDCFVNVSRVEAYARSQGIGHTPTAYSGGFVGKNQSSSLSITRSYAAGVVDAYAYTGNIFATAKRYAGGIIGYGGITVSYALRANTVEFNGNGNQTTQSAGTYLTQAGLRSYNIGSEWEFRGSSAGTGISAGNNLYPVLRVFFQPKSIVLNKTAMQITTATAQSTRQITATVYPSRANIPRSDYGSGARSAPIVIFSTNSSGVATVSPSSAPVNSSGQAQFTVTAASGAGANTGGIGTEKSATTDVKATIGNVSATANVVVTIPTTGISLPVSTITLPLGGSYQLSPIIVPSNASNKKVLYSHSNSQIASVNTSGLITAGSTVGTTRVYVDALGANYPYNYIDVTTYRPPTGVAFSNPPVTMIRGRSIQLYANVLPANASNTSITWSIVSSNPSGCATISSSGVVTANAVGSFIVRATAADTRNGTFYAQHTITIISDGVVGNDGAGGKGGKGGAGGNGGAGGFDGRIHPSSLPTGGGSGGAGSDGGIGGAGGYGSPEGAMGASGSKGNPGINRGTGLSKYVRSPIVTPDNPQLDIKFFTDTNPLVIRNGGRSTYHPTELFDTNSWTFGLRQADGTISSVPASRLEFRYDFTTLGTKLVTVAMREGSRTCIRYIPVNVSDPWITDVSFVGPSLHTKFFVDDPFVTDGMALEVRYSDGDLKLVTNGFIVNPQNATATEGENTITVTHPEYSGRSWTYEIVVRASEPEKIEVVTMPSKTNYLTGDTIDPSGSVFRVTNNNGFSYLVYADQLDDIFPIVLNETGTVSITCVYETVSVSFPVNVIVDVIEQLNIHNLPKQEYWAGSVFDPTGMAVEAITQSGRSVQLDTSLLTISPLRPLTLADTQITLTYFDHASGKIISATIPITVSPIPTVKTPTASLPSGTVSDGSMVTLFSDTDGAQIRFTTDGTEPTEDSQLFTTPIKITGAVMIKAKAFKYEYIASETATFIYTISTKINLGPTDSHNFGTVINGYDRIMPHSLTITNNDQSDTGVLLIDVFDENNTTTDNFLLSRKTIDNIQPGGSESITITPKADLPNGNYIATVAVGGVSTETASMNVSFTVVDSAASVISVSSHISRRGDEVEVEISLLNNPGFASLPLKVSFPDELTLKSYDLGHGSLYSGFTGPDQLDIGDVGSISNSFFVNWARTANFTQDGVLLKLVFATDANATRGVYDIKVTFETALSNSQPQNLSGEVLDMTIIDGTISLNPFILGDVDGNSIVDLMDASWLARRLAGHSAAIDVVRMEAATVTWNSIMSGTPDLNDVVRLRRLLAGHNVKLGN